MPGAFKHIARTVRANRDKRLVQNEGLARRHKSILAAMENQKRRGACLYVCKRVGGGRGDSGVEQMAHRIQPDILSNWIVLDIVCIARVRIEIGKKPRRIRRAELINDSLDITPLIRIVSDVEALFAVRDTALAPSSGLVSRHRDDGPIERSSRAGNDGDAIA